MTYNEIYKKFIFWKDKIDHNKIILYTKYNSIVITSSAKEHKTQIYNEKLEITKVNWHFPISLRNLLLTYLLATTPPYSPKFYLLMYSI
jgi:hypothetical protein